jgi:ParB family chromosome partitioning protein
MALAREWPTAATAGLQKLIRSEVFGELESDRRFELLIAELGKEQARPETAEYEWAPTVDGKIKGRLRRLDNSFTIALKMEDAPEFGEYLSKRLDELYEAYRTGKQTD